MLMDARSIESGTRLECDLCIVGTGPAGISIAHELRKSGLSIILVESGGLNVEVATQDLYRGEVSGHRYFRLDGCRWRLFGGSSNRWGGWCRPLSVADYASREWVPYSGWPIDHNALVPYQSEAAQLLELPSDRFDLDFWQGRLPPPLPLDQTNFENILFQHSPETNFAEKYGSQLHNSPGLQTILHATLTGMHLHPGTSRISKLDISTLTGRRLTILPQVVVLAAGGIENARLLLASRFDRTEGLGNEFDQVGRHFMEHLHTPLGHLLLTTDAVNNAFYSKALFEDVRLRGVIVPRTSSQAQQRLLSTSIAVENASYALGTPFVGWNPRITFGPVAMYRRLRSSRFKRGAEIFKQIAQRLHSLPDRLDSWRLAALSRVSTLGKAGRIYSLYFRGEQAPNPLNRVVLSGSVDALGVPRSRLQWEISDIDRKSIMGWLQIFDSDVRARAIGEVIKPSEDWADRICGGPHHMGTTRMSLNPRQGVVDAQCRVHSVDNLYIAGSSVFVTSGYVNPTFTIVALALRLAATIRQLNIR
jgi:choline dehydrogenase-like flavoprotein